MILGEKIKRENCVSFFVHIIFYFFLEGHGNESRDMIGSYRRPYFPISADGRGNAFVSRREHPSFFAIFHVYILFCRLGSIYKQVKPTNNLLILSFLYLKSLCLPAKNCFRN